MHKISKFSFGTKRAFTMQEVLIVLATIGVVFTLTMSILKFNSDSKYPAMKAAFKHDLTMAMANMNMSENMSSINSQADFINLFKDYYKIGKSCSSQSECGFADSYKDLGGGSFTLNNYSHNFRTANGISVSLSFVEANKNKNLNLLVNNVGQVDLAQDSYEVSNAALNYITGVYDVNGPQGPNVLGRDMGIIMPAYILSKNEYLTFQNALMAHGSAAFAADSSVKFEPVVARQLGKSIKEDKDKEGDVVVVSDEGVFDTSLAQGKLSSCSSQNYELDDYGSCVCGLTEAGCMAGAYGNPKGQNFNKKACECAFNASCPKNKVLKDGVCVCKNANLKCGPYSQEGNGNPPGDDCSCHCELGGALKCLSNGGVWNSETCSCSCSGGKATAEEKCSAQVEGNGYAAPNPNNYCACECNQQLFNDKIKDREVPPAGVTNYQYITQFDSDVNKGCFKCGKPAGSDIQASQSIKDGKCITTCSESERSFQKGFSEANKAFYEASTYLDSESVPNIKNACKPKCVLTDAYCKAHFKLDENRIKNQCPYFESGVNYYGQTWQWNRLLPNGCSYNGFAYSCFSNPDRLHPALRGKYITVKANQNTCQCELEYPQVTVNPTINNRYNANYGNQTWRFMTASGTNAIAMVNHGACGFGVGAVCYFYRDGAPLEQPNANNPYAAKRTNLTGVYVNEYCYFSYDPILLIMPKSGVPSSQAPAMKNGTVNISLAEGMDNKNITWLAPQNSSSPMYFFLVKKTSFDNAKNTLFTDMSDETGLVELGKKYNSNTADNNSEKAIINELDSNYSSLYLWADVDADAAMTSDEIQSLANAGVVEILTNTTITSTVSGMAEQSDKAITSLRGTFYAGVNQANPTNGGGTAWLRRVGPSDPLYATIKGLVNIPDADKHIYFVYITQNANGEPEYYPYIFDRSKDYTSSSAYTPVKTGVKMGTTNDLIHGKAIRQYYQKGGTNYEIKKYTLIDILFRTPKED